MLDRPADDLVDGIVASDILAQCEEFPCSGEQSGSMQSAGAVEGLLRLSQRGGHHRQHFRIDHDRVVHDGTIEALHSRYASRRSLVVDLERPLPEGFELPGTTLVAVTAERHRATFALESAGAGAAVAGLVAAVAVRDLSLVEPDIEDVVAKLYRTSDVP